MKTLLAAFCALSMAAALSVPAHADDKCAPAALSDTLEQRMKSEGKTDAEIADVLGSSFKRRILAGRVSDASGCPDTAVQASLDLLADKYK